MPAMLEDPTAKTIYRTSGENGLPTGELPPEIVPRQVTLRDRITTATLLPFSSPSQVPPALLSYLCTLLNREIEKGDTYPMLDPLPLETFGRYWFANFGAIMLLGEIGGPDEVLQIETNGCDWEKQCLGTFYVKPNYPGRSSHVCNAGFMVGDAARNKGVGRLMGECYLDWAPKLGYTYSVFNLVYETNVASLRIWDSLGFKRVGRIKGCGDLKSYPGELVDAIIFGRELGQENEEDVSEERFDKIRYYLKHGKYPSGADRAEKSRLRSAATHYKLLLATESEPEKLMLKGKEVISEPQRQYEIAQNVHSEHHAGINKTTAIIAEKYHWVRIKETVNLVIRNCKDCKSHDARAALTRSDTQGSPSSNPPTKQATISPTGPQDHADQLPPTEQVVDEYQQGPNTANMANTRNFGVPVDPRIMEGVEQSPYQQQDLLYTPSIEQNAQEQPTVGSPPPAPSSAEALIQKQLLQASYEEVDEH
ncbi:MAG: hypothetical protein M1820_009120 [Bogoriella megaspora]|nr:MAG: hypothetical protein M1820_009120 [Bogoriella megaspora]